MQSAPGRKGGLKEHGVQRDKHELGTVAQSPFCVSLSLNCWDVAVGFCNSNTSLSWEMEAGNALKRLKVS